MKCPQPIWIHHQQRIIPAIDIQVHIPAVKAEWILGDKAARHGIIIPGPHVVKISLGHDTQLAHELERLGEGFGFGQDHTKRRVVVGVDYRLGTIGNGNRVAHPVVMVAVEIIRRRYGCQQPGPVHIIPGNGVVCIRLGKEVAVCVIDIAGLHAVADRPQPVARFTAETE